MDKLEYTFTHESATCRQKKFSYKTLIHNCFFSGLPIFPTIFYIHIATIIIMTFSIFISRRYIKCHYFKF